MASLFSGFTFLAGLACEYFNLDLGAKLQKFFGKFTKQTIEMPSAMLITKCATALSIFGLGFSFLLEARYGTDVSMTKLKLEGPYKDKVYHRSLKMDGLGTVSMYYPGDDKLTTISEKADWLDLADDEKVNYLNSYAALKKA